MTTTTPPTPMRGTPTASIGPRVPLVGSSAAPPTGRRAERLLLPATFVTSLGNGIQLVASAILVFTTAGSALSVGWLFIAASVPPALLSLVFGRIADRYDRRTLCLIADVASALAALVLPVWLLLGGGSTPVAYLVSLSLAALSAMFMPASNALVKERVAPGRLVRFSAHYEIALQAGSLLSAAVGGLAIHLFGPTPLFFFNGVTFLVSALAMYLLGRGPAHTERAQPAATGTGTPTGRTTAPLLRLGLLYATCTVLTMVGNTVLIVLVYQGFHRGAGIYGLVDALAGVGFVAAAALYTRLPARFGHLRIAVVCIVGCAVIVAVEPLHLTVLLAGIPFAGALVGLARVATRSLLLASVPERRAGQVFGAANAAGLGLSAVVTVLVAAVADHTEIANAFYSLAVITAVITVVTAATLRRSPATMA
ncbi:MFS transporter [Micromonospora sp. WMMD1076]|uniref:MFS transporter n=1 Tax=Micromonospora sp. WMMD1076 TaxID=3016103 RepID=UPI00249B835D|nr:MFS transporter [Micromonospora sp. WMMD1076]WFF04628.1 MFS transporter [Micromonospora sp. WMMD1076]